MTELPISFDKPDHLDPFEYDELMKAHVHDIDVALQVTSRYTYTAQEYLYVIKGSLIFKFMICPRDPDYPDNGFLVEENARSFYRSEILALDEPANDSVVCPQIIELPGKDDIFLIYDKDSIEIVKCTERNDFLMHPRSA